MESAKKPRIFYGWIVVAGCMCIMGAAVGVMSNTLSVFIKPVSENLGIPRATFTAYTSFGMVTTLIMGPIWGEYFKSHRFRPAMSVACAMIACTMFCYSFATKVWQFYLIAAVKGVFGGALTGPPVAKILTNWFVDKRGTATGIAFSGSGLAGMIMTPIVSRTVQTMGWQSGYRQLAYVFLAITVPVLILVIREKPEDKGLLPYGYEKALAKAKDDPELTRLNGMTRAQALTSKTFWLYVASLFLISAFCMGIQNNVISYLSDIGYTPTYAASIFSITMGVLVPGKIVLGVIYDKFGMSKGTIYLCTAVVASAIALLLAKISGVPIVFAILFGFGNAIQTVPIAYMTGRLFGNREYTRIYGICQPAHSLGSAVGVPFTALLRDLCQSYTPVFIMSGVGAFAILTLMLAAIRVAPKEKADFDAINEQALAAARQQA